jgi:hypothetical protein
MGLLWPSKMAPYEKPSKCPNVIGFIDDMFVQFIDVFLFFGPWDSRIICLMPLMVLEGFPDHAYL